MVGFGMQYMGLEKSIKRYKTNVIKKGEYMPEADQGLAKLLKNIRTEENISLNDLSLGLMSVSQLSKVENGERTIDKNVRDRLLERLGIAKEIYENLFDICD